MEVADEVERLRALDDGAVWRNLLPASLDTATWDDLLAILKAESERHLTVDTHIALQLADALIRVAESAGRAGDRALGLMRKADALRFLGRYNDALALFDESARAFSEDGDEVGWARTRIGWVVASHFVGRAAEALSVASNAREVLVRREEWFRAAGLDVNCAAVCQWLGQYDRALELYDEALDFYSRAARAQESLRDATEIQAAMARGSAAEVIALRGDFASALALHSAAREVFIRQGDTLSVLREDQYIADVYAGQGDYTRALRLYADTSAALDRAGQALDAGIAALSAVECYLHLNLDDEALELAEETVARYERCGAPTESAKARFYCALALARRGGLGRAQHLLAESARTFEEAGMTGFLAITSLQRASLYLTNQDWMGANDEAARAHELFAGQGLVVRQAQAELVGARAALGLGRLDQAAGQAATALATTAAHGVLWLDHEGYDVLAGVARARGDLTEALAQYRAAVASIERVQGRLATELRTEFLGDKLGVYHSAIDCCLQIARPDLAFEYLERAKSRALVDYLAVHRDVRIRGDDEDHELLAELARLRDEHNWLYSQLYGYGLIRRDGSSDPAAGRGRQTEDDALRASIRDHERRIARIQARLALRRADSTESAGFAAVESEIGRPALDEGTGLVEYYLREADGVAFVLTGAGLTAVPLAEGRRSVRRLMSLWQLNLDASARALALGQSLAALTENARGVLGSLHRALLAPVEPYLVGLERLVVVPYGPAHAIPFHALHDGQRYLLQAFEVSVCPSSSLLPLCARRRRRGEHRALVIANSVGGRLPHVLREARMIADLLPGECYLEDQATQAALALAAPRYGIVHLAAHGESRLDNPAFAHLRLADGQLHPSDVFNLELDGALVALSACETGRSVVAGGDELIGLSRGFLYAGASTLVQSLWRVEDGSTAVLMVRFYEALKAGRTKGAALREAQLAALDAESATPYLWAPFQLVGDAGPL